MVPAAVAVLTSTGASNDAPDMAESALLKNAFDE
jgi:hypothetical protein